ncbi:hypothetical protein D9619_004566 [Psilocybe cf. subviscida]|uniref:Uncharacterized protein n=1 Tax=Psilocybe cf. subviscida TaxID=2480587 RepID=A0A8H5BPJ8_9AGAR|nr:hypothetical protein D9619_004566 [Psilocybe cf. subviscida]
MAYKTHIDLCCYFFVLDMIPQTGPDSSTQFQASPDSPLAYIYQPPGNHWAHTETPPNLYMQYPGAPSTSHYTVPGPVHALGPAPEQSMTRLQANLPPLEDMYLTQLGEIFPRFFANELSVSLPDNDMTDLSYDHDTFAVGLSTYSSHPTPPFDGVEGIQYHAVHVDTSHHQGGCYSNAGDTPTDMPFEPLSFDAHSMDDYSWSPGHGEFYFSPLLFRQSLSGSISASAYAPRTFGAGRQDSEMTISGRQHEAALTTSVAHLPPPKSSADTGLASSAHSHSSTPLPPPPPGKRTDNRKHIEVSNLFDQWRALQPDPLTEDSSVRFRAFCANEMNRLGHVDIRNKFRRQPKAVVGTPVSRADREKHKEATVNLPCPLPGCGSQFTRKHNLSREPYVILDI